MTLRSEYNTRLMGLGYLIYGAILILGNAPGLRGDIGAYASGFELHSLAYGVLAAIFYLALRARAAERIGFALLTIALMGSGDELIQSYFPYRHASIVDWSVDVAAALVVTLIMACYETWRRPGV